MELYAVYDKRLDLLTLSPIKPTDGYNKIICIRDFEKIGNTWVAVKNKDDIAIYTKQEYNEILNHNNIFFDKIAYYMEEI